MSDLYDDEALLPLAYRTMLMEETDFSCLFCGHRGSPRTLRIVWDIPDEFGGGDDRDNLLVACTGCRLQKAGLGLTGLEYDEWRTTHPFIANYGPL